MSAFTASEPPGAPASASPSDSLPTEVAETPESLLRRHASSLETHDPVGSAAAIQWLAECVSAVSTAFSEHGPTAFNATSTKFLARVAIPRLVASLWTSKLAPHLVPVAYGALVAVTELAGKAMSVIDHYPVLFSILYVLLGGKDDCFLLELQSCGGFPFIKTKSMVTPSGYAPPPPTFHSQFGLPVQRFICSKRVVLWPDELSKAAQLGSSWIGRRVQIHVPVGTESSNAVIVRIARYDVTTNEHLVYVEGSEQCFWDVIANRKPTFLDSQRTSRTLTYSSADIGTHVEVLWSSMKQFYQGVVTDFVEPGDSARTTLEAGAGHPQVGLMVTYTDGDVRWYHPEDFKQRKAFVLEMDIPRIPAEDFDDDLGDGLLTDPVTETRKRVRVPPPTLSPGMLPLIDKFQPVPETFAVRPASAMFSMLSMFQYDLLNVFGRSGGFAAFVTWLRSDNLDFWLAWRIVNVFQYTYTLLTPRVSYALMEHIRARALPFILSLNPDSFKAITKDDLNVYVSMVEGLLLKIGPCPLPDVNLPDPALDSDPNATPHATAGLEITGPAPSDVVEIRSTLDLFRQDLVLKLLNSNQLDKRLAAMKDLTALAESANHEDLVAASRAGTVAIDPNRSAFGDWLVRNNVVEGLFGENMHSELVKRCGPIVSFLAVRNKLKPEHVAAVLEASRGKHESTVLALYKLLVDMLPHMNGDCLQAIATGIRSLPLCEWNIQLLGFIRDFAIVAARMDRKSNRKADVAEFSGCVSFAAGLGPSASPVSVGVCVYGLDLLWAFMLDNIGSAAPVDAIEEATELFVSLLLYLDGKLIMSPSFPGGVAQLDVADASTTTTPSVSIKTSVIQRCLANLEANASSPQSLCLLQSVIGTYALTAKGWFSREKNSVAAVLESLHSKSTKGPKLMDLFFNNLIWYHQMMTSRLTALQAAGELTSRVGISALKLEGTRYTHADQMECRLEFMEFMLLNSNLEIAPTDRSYVTVVWTTLVRDALTMDCLDEGMALLGRLVRRSPEGYQGLSDDVVKILFERMLGWIGTLNGVVAPAASPAVAASTSSAASTTPPSQFAALKTVDGITPTIARVFMQYLLEVNVKAGNIKLKDAVAPNTAQSSPRDDLSLIPCSNTLVSIDPHTDESSNLPFMKRLSVDCVGLDALWLVALSARNHSVGNAAINLLITLHVNVSNHIKSKREKLLSVFVGTALKHVRDSAKELTTPDPARDEHNKRRVVRAVNVLKEFLNYFRRAVNPPVPTISFKFAVFLTEMASSVTVAVPETHTLAQLKVAVAASVGVHPDDIEIKIRNEDDKAGTPPTQVECTDASVKTLRVSGSQVLYIAYKRVDPTADVLPEPTPQLIAYMTSGYDLPVTFGLEIKPDAPKDASVLWNSLTGVPLAHDMTLQEFLSACDADILPPKPDMTLLPVSTPSGASVSSTGAAALSFSAADLVTPEAYNQLFELLTVDDDIGQAAWEIVQLLPTNKGKLEQLRSIDAGSGKLNWSSLLDASKPYSLLYSLQAMNAFLRPSAGDGPAVAKRRVEWVKAFVLLGGPQHLVHVLVSTTRRRRLGRASIDEAANRAGEDSAKCSIIAHICRILHAVLALDGNYVECCLGPHNEFGYSLRKLASETKFPPGALFTSVDLPVAVKAVIDGMVAVARLQRTETVVQRQKRLKSKGASSTEESEVRTGCSVAVYGMHLVTSCILSREDCLEALIGHKRFRQWLAYYVVEAPAVARFAVAQALARICTRLSYDVHPVKAAVVSKTAGAKMPSSVHVQTMSLTSFVSSHMVAIMAPARRSELSSHFFALLGVLLVDHHRVVSSKAGSKSDADVSVVSTEEIPAHDVSSSQIGLLEDPLPSVPSVNVDARTLFHDAAMMLYKAQSAESFHMTSTDFKLVGLLTFLQYLVQFDPSLYDHEDVGRLVPWVFTECLFPTPTVEASRASGKETAPFPVAAADAPDGKDDDEDDPDVDTVALPSESGGSAAVPLLKPESPVKPDATDEYANFGPLCKTPPSRQAAYSLLATLCNGPDNSCRLLSLLDTVADVERDDGFLGRETKAWGYDPRALQKPSHQHTGLVNQGATCYLNSFLQQLFHIPTFRSELLSAEDSSENLLDSVLFQLQVLFGKLQISQKRYCDTRSFCLSFKDYDGTPIRMGEQRDVNEFANMLFEKLEGFGSNVTSLIKKTFGGTFVNQIISKETPYRSEQTEPFHSITLTIQNKASLEESLQALIEGDLLSGENKYQLPDGSKVDAVKRQCVRELPQHLILHLKRFEFDFDTLRRKKLNDRCVIPERLNMKPFTEEGIAAKEAEVSGGSGGGESRPQLEMRPDWYYEYELRGIVAHVGTADSGHYYSFIKEREGKHDGQWFEFNDRIVAPFSPEKIPEECYGGTYSVDRYDARRQGYVKVEVPRNNNAYLVIYDRVQPPEDVTSPTKKQAAVVAQVTTEPGPAVETTRQQQPPSLEMVPLSSTLLPEPALESKLTLEFGALSNVAGVPVLARSPTGESKSDLEGNISIASRDQSTAGLMSAKLPLFRDMSYSSIPDNDLDSEFGSPVLRPHTWKPELTTLSSAGGAGGMALSSEATPMLPTLPSVPDKRGQSWLPPKVLRAVWSENSGFLLDRSIFSLEYFKFVRTITNLPVNASADPDVVLPLEDITLKQTKLATTFVLTVLVLAKDRSLLPTWMRSLKRMMITCPAACMWLCDAFSCRTDWLKRLLLRCPHASTRSLIVDLLLCCVSVLKPLEDNRYEALTSVAQPSEDPHAEPRTVLEYVSPTSALIEAVVKVLRVEESTSPQILQLFDFLRGFVDLGDPERRLVIQSDMLQRLVEFYIGEYEATTNGITQLYNAYKGRNDIVDMSRLLDVIFTLVRACNGDDGPRLLHSCTDKILYGPFVSRAVLGSMDVCVAILLHLSRNDVPRSMLVTNLLCNSVLTATSPAVTSEFRPLQAALAELLLHEDDMTEARVEAAMPAMFDRMDRMLTRQQPGDGVYVCLVTRLLLALAMQSRVAHAFLTARKGKWESWVQVYKDEVRRSRTWPTAATSAPTSAANRSGAAQGGTTSGTSDSDPYKFNIMNPAAAGFGLPSSQFY